MNDKLQTIEETLAHQDQQIADLSEMVIRQSDELAALRKAISKLQGKLENLQDDTGQAPLADQKPPHY